MLLILSLITPIPKEENLTSDYEPISSLKYVCRSGREDCSEFVKTTTDYYETIIFPTAPINAQSEFLVDISMRSTNYPRDYVHTNETYSLKTSFEKLTIFIEVDDIFGLARALSTLAQLVASPDYSSAYRLQNASVYDYPTYKYRGVMVDSARHFLLLETLYRQVRALSIAKMNVLHIHEVDSQSFPMQTTTAPGSNFARAAYVTGKRYVHTPEEYGELTQYAAKLGVFVITELDIPGHASSWQFAEENITCNCGGRDVINPVNPDTYEHIRTYFKDLFLAMYKPLNMTPMVHLGGDEVQHWCFNNDQAVSNYMKQNGMTTQSLWKELHLKVKNIINNISLEMYPNLPENERSLRAYWQESFSNGNDHTQGGVVHSWMSSYVIREAATKNLYTIRSEAWYLDVNEPGPSFYSFVDSWQGFYGVKVAENVPEDKEEYVLGGEAAQWGEKVNDGNIDEEIWPRSIASGEILWSEPSDRTITSSLKKRLNRFTCKLRQGGIRTGAVINGAPCMGVDDTAKGKLEDWRGEKKQEGYNGRE